MFGSFMPFLRPPVIKPPLKTSFESKGDLFNSGTTSASISTSIGNSAKLVIGLYCFNTALTVSGVKVGANSAQLIGYQINGFSMWILDKPSGTTGTLTITLPSSAGSGWGYVVWGIDEIIGDISSQILTSAASPAVVSMPVLSGGVILAMAAPAANGLTTWSGLPNIDVANHSIGGTVTRRFNAARGGFLANQNVPITATYSASSANRFMFAASLR